MSIHTEHSAADCDVCAAQQEADAIGATPTAGHEPQAQPQETSELLTLSELEQIEARWSDFDDHEDDFYRLLGHCKALPADLPRATVDKDDYDLAYAIMEEMGLGFKIRNCSCGQLPCLRLRPIAEALAKREAEVGADLPRATEGEMTVEAVAAKVRELEPFCEHKEECRSNERYPSPPCDCGLAIALATSVEFSATEQAGEQTPSTAAQDAAGRIIQKHAPFPIQLPNGISELRDDIIKEFARTRADAIGASLAVLNAVPSQDWLGTSYIMKNDAIAALELLMPSKKKQKKPGLLKNTFSDL